jgi:hypothetical protein
VTEIVPFGGEEEPRDLEAEANRALERLRADPAGERLAEMLPDILLVGISYLADVFGLLGKYRGLATEIRRRQYIREAARTAAPAAIAAPPEPPEEKG